MKRLSRLTYLALPGMFLFLLGACSSASHDMKKIKWILGKWESKTQEGTLYENWEKLDDSTYLGNAYSIVEGDTTFSEEARIMSRKGVIVYSVTVNNEETTDFELVNDEKEAVFENPEHDYPQRIIYMRNGKDSLYARIEGMVDDVLNKEEFRYVQSR
jgi:hypothetical protein